MDINKQFSTNPYKHVPRSFITLVFFLKKFIRKTRLVRFAEFQFTVGFDGTTTAVMIPNSGFEFQFILELMNPAPQWQRTKPFVRV